MTDNLKNTPATPEASFAETAAAANQLFETHGKDFVIDGSSHPEVIKGFAAEILAELEAENKQ